MARETIIELVDRFFEGEGTEHAPLRPCSECGTPTPWGGDDEAVCRQCVRTAVRLILEGK